ncbi:nucleoside-diphosphate kinase [Hoeflea ulvae]|uniref:Nucleoside-diphosphate kinase n=1 Tax=Hoeflea ulvae TaxID=2983764 RepID=A0ABT3YKD7_9HYPH|nr:nucleoside-diphosphate kinase [Hoeflea ulvae]MCY0096239.1 nucleoside-diphosphate kinase [Hoeflea ulvae]
MWNNQPCILTSKDFTILETMYQRRHLLGDRVRLLLKQKLDATTVVFAEDIDDTIVTLNSRVRYRISGHEPQTAIITQSPMGGVVGQSLSLETVRGMALLGLPEAAEWALPARPGEAPERIELLAVQFQPEAARRERLARELARPALRLVHDATLGR